jgi:restriction system protein
VPGTEVPIRGSRRFTGRQCENDAVSSIEIPSVSQLYWPTICALRELGGSGTVGEIVEKVIELEDFSEEQQAVPHTQGTRTALEYRLAWARTHLKMVDLL